MNKDDLDFIDNDYANQALEKAVGSNRPQRVKNFLNCWPEVEIEDWLLEKVLGRKERGLAAAFAAHCGTTGGLLRQGDKA